MKCKTYALNELVTYKFVVVLSRYEGKIMLSRHKKRSTWENQGGHIEELGSLPDSEMAEIGFFDELPENLTYPEITQILFEKAGQFWTK